MTTEAKMGTALILIVLGLIIAQIMPALPGENIKAALGCVALVAYFIAALLIGKAKP